MQDELHFAPRQSQTTSVEKAELLFGCLLLIGMRKGAQLLSSRVPSSPCRDRAKRPDDVAHIHRTQVVIRLSRLLALGRLASFQGRMPSGFSVLSSNMKHDVEHLSMAERSAVFMSNEEVSKGQGYDCRSCLEPLA
eukprot:4832753-Amphidinium_carterae.2